MSLTASCSMLLGALFGRLGEISVLIVLIGMLPSLLLVQLIMAGLKIKQTFWPSPGWHQASAVLAAALWLTLLLTLGGQWLMLMIWEVLRPLIPLPSVGWLTLAALSSLSGLLIWIGMMYLGLSRPHPTQPPAWRVLHSLWLGAGGWCLWMLAHALVMAGVMACS